MGVDQVCCYGVGWEQSEVELLASLAFSVMICGCILLVVAGNYAIFVWNT